MPFKNTSKAKEAAKKRMQRYRNKGVTRPVTPEPVTPYIADVTPSNVTPDVTPCVTPDLVTPVTPKNKPVKPCKNCIILQGQINKLKAIISAGKKKIEPAGDKSALCRHRLTYCRICN